MPLQTATVLAFFFNITLGTLVFGGTVVILANLGGLLERAASPNLINLPVSYWPSQLIKALSFSVPTGLIVVCKTFALRLIMSAGYSLFLHLEAVVRHARKSVLHRDHANLFRHLPQLRVLRLHWTGDAPKQVSARSYRSSMQVTMRARVCRAKLMELFKASNSLHL